MLQPEPPRFPADPALRASVEEAERFGEELQDAARRLFYCLARRKPSPWTHIMGRGQRRIVNAADFEIATNTRLLLACADSAPAIAGRPAAAHARRVVPEFPGSFPAL